MVAAIIFTIINRVCPRWIRSLDSLWVITTIEIPGAPMQARETLIIIELASARASTINYPEAAKRGRQMETTMSLLIAMEMFIKRTIKEIGISVTIKIKVGIQQEIMRL